MAISYKTRWQDAEDQVKKLEEKIKRLQRQHQRELDKIYAFITGNRDDLAATRPIIDLAGIARHMNVARWTPQQWQQRGLLPPVDFPEIKGEPLWYASTIREQFARQTGRPWYDRPPEEEQDLSPAA